ncbi:unnamed protein product [Prunus armeniaca]
MATGCRRHHSRQMIMRCRKTSLKLNDNGVPKASVASNDDDEVPKASLAPNDDNGVSKVSLTLVDGEVPKASLAPNDEACRTSSSPHILSSSPHTLN